MSDKSKGSRLSGAIPTDYKEFIAAKAKQESIPEIYYIRGLIKEKMDKEKRAKK